VCVCERERLERNSEREIERVALKSAFVFYIKLKKRQRNGDKM